MFRRFIVVSIIILASFVPASGFSVFENEACKFSLRAYTRADLVSIKNQNSLNGSNRDDSSTYLGLDYHIALQADGKDGRPSWYVKVERNGPYDYDAPLFVHNTLMPSGVVEEYRDDELFPQVEEFWVDAPLPGSFGLKTGLYSYQVGNGFALNGGYENYGLSLYHSAQGCSLRMYYCRPDLVYKNHLGPRIRQEEEQGIDYQHNAANFYAVDAVLKGPAGSLQGYAGALVDHTSSGKRDNSFAAPVDRDILGTFGAAGEIAIGAWQFKLEGSRNFGKGRSADRENYEDITHSGYLVYAAGEYTSGRVSPSLQVVLCSGNEVTLDNAAAGDTAIQGGRNRAFSYSSPLNKNISDSISSSNSDMLPIVAMGGGYGLNYGVDRPGTFSPGDFDNLIMPSLGADYRVNEKLTLGLYGYYLRSFTRGAGMSGGEPVRLSAELGSEADIFCDYQLREGMVLSFLGGYFVPGRYYRQARDDTGGSLLSPFVRGDGNAEPAYQVELVLETRF